MSSIIERPWSEEAFRDFGSETKYGTSSEQSNQTDSSSSSEGSKSEKTHATAAAGDEDEDDCIDMFNVTKGASISPFYMIICDGCGMEMDNTLMCPGCERERPGRLIYNTCKFCDDFPVGHKSDSCPRKDNPVCYELPSLSVDHESNDIALMSDYEPSSP